MSAFAELKARLAKKQAPKRSGWTGQSGVIFAPGYTRTMDRDAIRAFVARDRDRVAALKRDHHARAHRASRGTSGLDAARALRDYVRRVRPDWPTARDRDEDFAHHVALKGRIDRAAHAFAPR